MALLSEPKDNGTKSLAIIVRSHGIVGLESISRIGPKKDGGPQSKTFFRQGRKGVPQCNGTLRRGPSSWHDFLDYIILNADTTIAIQTNTNYNTNSDTP